MTEGSENGLEKVPWCPVKSGHFHILSRNKWQGCHFGPKSTLILNRLKNFNFRSFWPLWTTLYGQKWSFFKFYQKYVIWGLFEAKLYAEFGFVFENSLNDHFEYFWPVWAHLGRYGHGRPFFKNDQNLNFTRFQSIWSANEVKNGRKPY